jgi:hypothetical protein
MSMIHKTGVSRRVLKKLTQEINLAKVSMVNVPEYVGSKQSIMFTRADHPKYIPRPGDAALVLEAQIGGFNVSKVFMDGGSGLNLSFASTMKAKGITADMLQESNTGFHGIVPTLPADPLGKLSLDVVFGKPDNFWKERLEIEVVNWESQYHVILGRPAYAKFMVLAHYAYLKLKMPGNNGTTITVHGSFSRSDNCDREFQKITSKFGIKQEIKTLDIVPKKSPLDDRESKPEEVDSGKKSKKQPDDPATSVQDVKTSAAAVKTSAEVVKTSTEVTDVSAAAINASTEAIGATVEAIGTSTDVSKVKADPPLT